MSEAGDKPAIFRASYADLKIIKTRKVVQIVAEIPVEASEHALKVLGGLPRADQEVWLAIARLDPEKAKDTPEAAREPWKPPYSYTQQAAIRGGEVIFWAFLREVKGFNAEAGLADEKWDADLAADVVRIICKVKSRAEFDADPEAGARWVELEREYAAWRLAQ